MQNQSFQKVFYKRQTYFVDDVLEVNVNNGVITLMKPFRHKSLEERAAEYNGKLNLDGEFDWVEPLGREVWK